MFTPFFEKWWKAFELSPLRETKANCASCTMVHPPQNETLRDPGPFDSNLKCCTYFPFLPNFSAGKIAGRGDVGSTKLVLAAERGFQSPLGIFSRDEMAPSRKGFGTDPSLRCPFLTDSEKSCSIWSERPSVCASYFCVSSKGAAGLQFWSRSEELGNQIEWTVAHEALWSVGYTADETAEMLAAVEARDADRVAQSWLEWRGREAELYAKCLEFSESLTAERLRESLGPEGEMLIRELQRL